VAGSGVGGGCGVGVGLGWGYGAALGAHYIVVRPEFERDREAPVTPGWKGEIERFIRQLPKPSLPRFN